MPSTIEPDRATSRAAIQTAEDRHGIKVSRRTRSLPRPLRIAYLSRLSGIGGGETALVDLVRGMKALGAQPHAILGSDGPLASYLIDAGSVVCTIPHGRFSQRPHLTPSIMWRFMRYLKDERISLVHANDFSPLVYSSLPSRLLKIPVVWSCHGDGYGSSPKKLFYHLFVDRAIFVSETVRRQFMVGSPISYDRTEVVHLGVDTRRFVFNPEWRRTVRQQLSIPDDQFVACIVGRFQPVKGHDVFIRAAERATMANPGLKFLIVGGDAFGTREERLNIWRLTSMVSKSKLLNSSVRLLGFRADIPAVLAASDCLVCASRYESFGMAVAEAMSCSRPVISTRCGGPEEFIVDGESGFLVDIDDAESIADKLLLLADDPDMVRRMGERSRKQAENILSLDRYVKRISRIYAEVLS